jgi:DNA-binding NarL/FixJ family response regulator
MSTASICLDLIFRHAPRLMREGGGPIEEDRNTNKLSAQTVEAILRRRKSGMPIKQIGAELGVSRAAVQVHCKRHGVTPL